MSKTGFTDKFEHIFCLNLSHRDDRRHKMIAQLDDLGVLHSPKFSWHISTSHLHSGLMAKAVINAKVGNFSFPNELNCAREHWTMVKQAYDFGYQNVLIIEDDVLIIKNLDFIGEVLDNIPEDYDLLQFGGFSASPETVNAPRINPYWMKAIGAWNCSMYALSRKGMKYYMKCQETFFTVADNPLYIAYRNEDLVKAYLCVKPVVIQEISEDNKSDIRPDTEVTRNLNVNLYESKIDRTEYGIGLG